MNASGDFSVGFAILLIYVVSCSGIINLGPTADHLFKLIVSFFPRSVFQFKSEIKMWLPRKIYFSFLLVHAS